jgi:hypothetical protein
MARSPNAAADIAPRDSGGRSGIAELNPFVADNDRAVILDTEMLTPAAMDPADMDTVELRQS